MQDAAAHPLLEQLHVALGDRIAPEPVHFSGAWVTSSRRTYTGKRQLGTGAGPFVEVVDLRWQGTLSCASPCAGLAFLLTMGHLYWVKAPEISLALSLDVSLHAYAEYRPERATFTARLGGASLPGVPVSLASDPLEACTIRAGLQRTGRVSCVVQAESAALFVLLFPRVVLKVGRKHLWRIREEIASSLPPDIRELLTRRRAGSIGSARA